MRILIAHNTAHYLYMHYKELLKALKARMETVYVLAPADDAFAHMSAMGLECHEIALHSRSLNPVHDLATFRQYRKKLRDLKPDIVFNRMAGQKRVSQKAGHIPD